MKTVLALDQPCKRRVEEKERKKVGERRDDIRAKTRREQVKRESLPAGPLARYKKRT